VFVPALPIAGPMVVSSNGSLLTSWMFDLLGREHSEL
jgi:hypothetical protein